MNRIYLIKRWRPVVFALLSVFLLCSFQSKSQEIKTIGIDEAVKLGILNSKTLRISKAQIEASRARLQQAKDRMLPNVGVSGSYYRLSQPDITLGSGLKNLLGGSHASSGTSSGSTGASSSGTGTGSSASSGGGLSFPKINQATLAQANLSEPIFAGFKTRYAIRSEEFLLKAAGYSDEHSKEEVMLNTISAYYNIYKLQANKTILQQDLDDQSRRVKDFSNLEQNGLLTRNDLLKAQVQQSTIQLSLLEVSNALEVSLYNLKVMLGLPEAIKVQIDTLSIFNQHTLKSKEDYLLDALNQRTDLQAQAIQQETGKLNIKSAKSGYYPSIAFNAGFIDAWIPNFITVKNVITASIGLQYNLTGIFTTKHKVQEAKAGLMESQAQYDQLSDNIRMSVNQNYLGYTESLQKIELTGSTIAQAAENYRILNNKYKNSLSTLTDLLDGEVSVLQARINQASARADAEIAWYNLLNSSGSTISSGKEVKTN